MNLRRHVGLFSWAVAAKSLPLVYGLSMILVVMPVLPLSDFGRFSIIFSLFNFIASFNRSLFLQPMLRFASDPERFGSMTSVGLMLSAGFYLICGVAVWSVTPFIAQVLRLQLLDVRLVPALMAVFFLRDYGFFIQQIKYRTFRIFLIEVCFWIGSAVGFIILALTGRLHTVYDVLTVTIVAASLSSLMSLLVGSISGVGRNRIDLESVRKLIRYGVISLPTGLAGSLLLTADTLVLGSIYTPVEVAIYNGAKWVYRVASALVQAAGMLITPYAARLSAAGDKNGIRELFEKSIGYLIVGLSVLAALGLLASGPFYRHFLAGAYLASTPLLQILLIAAPFEGLFIGAGGILYGIGNAGRVAVISTGTLVILMLSLFPAVYFLQGMGAALSVVLALTAGGIWMAVSAGRSTGSGLTSVIRRLFTNLTNIKVG